MTDEDLAARAAGEAIAVRTLDAVRDCFYVIGGGVTTDGRRIRIDTAWRWDVDCEYAREITDALARSGRRRATVSNNEVVLTGCKHTDQSPRCRCHFGEVLTVETGAIVDPTELLPHAHTTAGGARFS
jgi:hypothetical protein